jgi:hypothetical protein
VRLIPTEAFLASDDGTPLTEPFPVPATVEVCREAARLARIYGPIQKPKEKSHE